MTLDHLTRPARGDAEGLLVLFHGRGADERDLFPLLDSLDPERRLLGVTPRGPLALPPGGAHWYALYRLGYPDPETFSATYSLASGWLDGLGFPPERTILGGFSQGGVMAYALGLTKGRPRPARLIELSCFMPSVPGYDPDLEPPLPPVAIGHGVYDDVIGVEWGRAARDVLTSAGAEVLYRESPMGHSIDPGFLDEIARWLPRFDPR
jgi:phospholipase/carboxylesterase